MYKSEIANRVASRTDPGESRGGHTVATVDGAMAEKVRIAGFTTVSRARLGASIDGNPRTGG